MIICSKCGKENQDHYKFCLGCGSELTGPLPASVPLATAAAGPAATSPTPPAGMRGAMAGRDDLLPTIPPGAEIAAPPLFAAGAAPGRTPQPSPSPFASPPAELAAPAAAPAAGMANCPSCGTPNPVGFTFCGNCGARLKAPQQPVTMRASAAKAAAPVKKSVFCRLSLIRPDGSEGGTHDIHEREVTLGRGSGPLFDSDAYLSPQHVRLVFDQGDVLLEDLGSLNGVFIRITEPEQLQSGDVFRIGQELLRFDAIGEPELTEDGTEVLGSPNPGYWGRLSLIVSRGTDGSAFPLMGDEMILGRERGDILFSDDGYVSGTHAKISLTDAGVHLSDLGSSNGTFIRLPEPRTVPLGTYILMGQQLFRMDVVD